MTAAAVAVVVTVVAPALVLTGGSVVHFLKSLFTQLTGSSPPKGTRPKKSLQSPAVTEITPQVVTVTKQEKPSNDRNSSDGNSTGDKNSSNSNSTGSASATMTTQFDAKLEHVLTHFLGATGADHHIQKACINKQILNFEDFTDGCTLENIKTFQQDDGTNNLVQAFSSVKLTLVTNVILYYDFLQHDNQEVLAEDPINWVKADFRKWRRNPIVNTNTNAGTATVTTAATAAVVKQKQQDDSFLSWRRSRKDEKDYPVLNNNREFIEWDVKFERKIRSDKIYRMIDTGFHKTSLDAGLDMELYQR